MNTHPETSSNPIHSPFRFTHQAISPDILQRAMGALLGSAVGDALGAPFEFGPSGQYSDQFPQPVLGGLGEMIGGGSFG